MKLIFVLLSFGCCLNLVFSVEIVPDAEIVKFNFTKDVTLQCNVKNGDGKTHQEFTWKKVDKGDHTMDPSRFTFSENPYNATMTITRATEEDAGNYTCVTKSNQSAYVYAASSIFVNTPENVNVVEGEKLRIVCTALGKPAPEIIWTVGEMNYTTASGRITLQPDPEKNVPNAVLLIDNVNMTDRGVYKCIGYSPITLEFAEDESMVRVKDKYAALWPFLGICLEVFVLCAIILIYEKKRNKTELEESDTDQSPDQKNTPDHGKESNLRHRQ